MPKLSSWQYPQGPDLLFRLSHLFNIKRLN